MIAGVDEFEPTSGDRKRDQAKDAAGQLVVPRRAGAIDREVADNPLDAVASLVERPIMLLTAKV